MLYTGNSFFVERSISFIFVIYTSIFFFFWKIVQLWKKIRTKLWKKSVSFTDKMVRLSETRVPVVNLCCEHNTWTISEGTTPTNNKRMARHGTAPFACSSGPERSIWSPKHGNPCKSRQLQTRQTLDWHSCIFVQVKELANLFYFSVYSVFLKYCVLNDILMLQRVLSYILRYMHIGNLLKKNRTYPAHIFVKGISSELLYFF